MKTINFGKYKGSPLREIPEDYLVWLIDTRKAELKEYEEELVRREEAIEADTSIAERMLNAGYRTMAQKVHPDVGGSTREMQELNAARDLLMGMFKQGTR